MHMPHRGRASVPARADMEVLKSIEVLAGVMPPRSANRDAKVVRSGAEGLGLFQQYRMASERLAVGRSKRHGIALRARPFAEIIVCR